MTIPVNDYYDGLARDRALETLKAAHRQIAVAVIRAGSVEAWREAHRAAVERGRDIVSGMIESEEMTLSRLTVAANLLADLARD